MITIIEEGTILDRDTYVIPVFKKGFTLSNVLLKSRKDVKGFSKWHYQTVNNIEEFMWFENETKKIGLWPIADGVKEVTEPILESAIKELLQQIKEKGTIALAPFSFDFKIHFERTTQILRRVLHGEDIHLDLYHPKKTY